jgi:RNA polymerase sigma-70 factor (ECF subfamily)
VFVTGKLERPAGPLRLGKVSAMAGATVGRELFKIATDFAENAGNSGCGCTEEAVVQLYQTLRSPLRWYGYHLLGSASDAEDLVQLAFLKVFDQLKRQGQVQNPRNWLYRIVHNLAIDELRRLHRQTSVKEDGAHCTDAAASPLSAEDELIQRQIIAKSLQVLNERERRCLMLRAQGLSYKEISQALAISAKSVSVYLARGQKKFESQRSTT